MAKRNQKQEYKRRVKHKQLLERSNRRIVSEPAHDLNTQIIGKDAIPVHYRKTTEEIE